MLKMNLLCNTVHHAIIKRLTTSKFDMLAPQTYIVKARCVTTKKARKDGCLPAPAPVGRRKIIIMNDRGTMII